jgi:hypothetical protein
MNNSRFHAKTVRSRQERKALYQARTVTLDLHHNDHSLDDRHGSSKEGEIQA